MEAVRVRDVPAKRVMGVIPVLKLFHRDFDQSMSVGTVIELQSFLSDAVSAPLWDHVDPKPVVDAADGKAVKIGVSMHLWRGN